MYNNTIIKTKMYQVVIVELKTKKESSLTLPVNWWIEVCDLLQLLKRLQKMNFVVGGYDYPPSIWRFVVVGLFDF